QDYQAELGLRVRNLSRATKSALLLTRRLHGYVRSVDYGSGRKSGTAYLVVRIPIGSVQAAIVKFSALGTILSQHVSITDQQPVLDARFRQMQALRRQITITARRLQAAGLTSEQQQRLEARL